MKVRKILKAVIFGVLTAITLLFIILGCNHKQAKAEEISKNGVVYRGEQNYYWFEIELKSDIFGFALLDDQYGDMPYILKSVYEEYINNINGNGWISSADYVNATCKMYFEIDFNRNVCMFNILEFSIIQDNQYYNLIDEYLLISDFGDFYGTYSDYIGGDKWIDFDKHLGIYNEYWHCGFYVDLPISPTIEGFFIPTKFINQFDTQGVTFEYANDIIDYNYLIQDKAGIYWNFGTHNYGYDEWPITYMIYEDPNKPDPYLTGVNSGIRRVEENPNKYDLYTWNQYTHYGEERYQTGYNKAMEDNENFTGSWFIHIFTGLSAIFNIQIFGQVTLGMICLIPFAIEFVFVIFKVIRGGES